MLRWQVLVGDVRERLAELPDQSVQCCVTSPPYWGLRDYGTASWEGGDPACDHVYNHGVQGATGQRADRTFTGQAVYRSECRKCGARRVDNQIGLEPTPDAYVASMVRVFADVRRLLRDDGVLWINIGDSYIGSGMTGGTMSKEGSAKRSDRMFHGNRRDTVPGYKQKDLAGIPWLLAFALRADGWYLRSDIIWAKPNPMPESVTDRPTKAHEYVFLLTKNARYYYDHEAIKEAQAESTIEQYKRVYEGKTGKDFDGAGVQNARDVKARTVAKYRHNAVRISSQESANRVWDDPDALQRLAETGRNCRSVWTITTQPYHDTHFATFPEALPERCIKAGTKPGDTVLDPFCGSGTTGAVAIKNGCHFIGIELNPAYVKLARQRIGGASTLFAQEVTWAEVSA